jgi:hypothetical protein
MVVAVVSDPDGALADCCDRSPKGAINPINIKVIIWSAASNAAPTSLFVPTVRLIILLMVIPDCWESGSPSPGRSKTCVGG